MHSSYCDVYILYEIKDGLYIKIRKREKERKGSVCGTCSGCRDRHNIALRVFESLTFPFLL